MPKNYWMAVVTPDCFYNVRQSGFTVHEIRTEQRKKVQRIESGDRFLYYVSGIRRFTATATATSGYLEIHPPEGKEGKPNSPSFRVHIKPDIVLRDTQFLDALQIAPRLEYVHKWPPEDWYIAFNTTNLHLIPKKDFQLIEDEMRKVILKGAKNSL